MRCVKCALLYAQSSTSDTSKYIKGHLEQ